MVTIMSNRRAITMMRKKSIVVILTVLTLWLGWVTAAGAQTDGTVTIVRAICSGETDPGHPALSMMDGNAETDWRLKPGSSGGWVELDLEQVSLIQGIKLNGVLAQGSQLVVEFRQNGRWIPFVGSVLTDIPTDGVIDLSYDRTVTDGLRLRLTGTAIGDCRLAELTVLGREARNGAPKIQPIKITSENASSNSPAGFLTDGNTYTRWLTDLTTQGNVTFQFSKPARVSHINFYFTSQMRGNFKLSAFIDGLWQDLGPINPKSPGWFRLDLSAQAITTDKIRLRVTGLGVLGGISEVEFWGTGDEMGDLCQPISVSSPQNLSVAFNTNFTMEKPEDRQLEILCREPSNETLTIDLNGQTLAVSPAFSLRGQAVYTVLLPSENFRKGWNYLRIHPTTGETTLMGVRLVRASHDNECRLPAGPLSDGLVLTGNVDDSSVTLPLSQSMLLERVEVYASAGATITVSARVDDAWVDLSPVSGDEGRLVFSGPVIAGSLRISNPGGFTIHEVRAFGSLTTDQAPTVRITHPDSNIIANSCRTSNITLKGFVDNPDAQITVNGEPVHMDGHTFTYLIRVFGRPLWEEETYSVVATDAQNRQGQDSVDLLIGDPNNIKLDQDDQVYYSNQDTFNISGTMLMPFSKVYVNDQLVSVSNNGRFSANSPLQEGLNVIPVKVAFSYGNEKTFIWKRTIWVVRYSKSMTLTIDSPLPNSSVSSQTVNVCGTVQGLGDVQVKVNNISASVDGLFYSASVPLHDGNNTIIVTASDIQGGTAQQQITVTRNQNAPVISQVTPADGTITNNGSVEVAARVSDADALWVSINGQVVQAGSDAYYRRTLSMEDGVHTIAIDAQDQAGNVATYQTRVTTDTQPPQAFVVTANPAVLTNNSRPTITFAAMDATSGIDHYELSIDDGTYQTVTSPFQLPTQTDGEHTIKIKAVDKAGWTTIGSTKIYIDTTSPGLPPNFRVVPGNGRMVLKWDAVSEDTVKYRIERSASSDGAPGKVVEVQGVAEYADESLTNGSSYKYRITAIDAANNASPTSDWKEAMVGLAVTDYQPDKGTAVEYDGVALAIPKEDAPSDVSKIKITEISSPYLDQKAIYPRVGPIYEFVAEKSDGTAYESIVFHQNYLGRIQYDLAQVPKGFPEENLGVYYYDPEFDRWFLLPTSAVDKEHHTIYFVTNHFCAFSVKATVVQDLSPQELKDSGYSPLHSYCEYGGVNVSPQGGTASTSVTELVLPGKNGFNLVLKRRYDTSVARNDAFSLSVNGHMAFNLRPDEYVTGGLSFYQVEDSINGWMAAGKQLEDNIRNILEQYLFNQGDYAYSMGQGWRLNLPYVKAANSGMILVLPDGAMHSLSEMDKVADGGILAPIPFVDKNGNESISPIQVRKVTYKQHEGDDFMISVLEVNAGYDITGIVTGQYKGARWYAIEYEVTMKDGTVFIMDGLGRTTKITDPTGLNSIKVCYNDLKLDKIIDSVGRIVRFHYTSTDNLLHQCIDHVWVENDPYQREVHYDVDGTGLLKSAIDVGGRKSFYEYDKRILFGGDIGFQINFVEMILKWIFPEFYLLDSILGGSDIEVFGHLQVELMYPMIQVTAPGQGTVHIGYDQKTITYGTHKIHRLFGIPISISFSLNLEQRLLANQVDVYRDMDLKQRVKSTHLDYDFQNFSDGEPFIRQTTENDGNKKTIYYYTAVEKERYQWNDTHLSDDPWLTADHIPQYTSQISFPVQVSDTVILPLQTAVEIYDVRTDRLLERQENTYDTDTMQPLTQTTWHGQNFRKLTYTYDNWGNVTEVTDHSESNGRINDTTTWMHYFRTTSQLTPDMATVVSPFYSLSLETGPKRYDLLLYKVTINRAPTEIPGFADQYLRTSYQYNSLGQATGEAQWDGVKWQQSQFKYDSPCGNLTQKIDPSGHITDYTYDEAGFPTAVIERDIHNVDHQTSDIVTCFGYDAATGWKAWQKNPRGYVTQYQYDALGRTTTIIAPDDNDDPTWIPNRDNPAFRSGNPTTTMQYNDTELTSLVTDPLDHKTLYGFDELGRLDRIIKYKQVNGEDAEYAVTGLSYDPWGNIISITDPNHHITQYEYDALGRNIAIVYPKADDESANPRNEMSFNYQTNVLTIKDEKGNITTIYQDMQGRTLRQVQQEGFVVIASEHYYDGLGNEVATVDPRGNKVANTFDERNLLTRTDLPEASFWENGQDVTTKPYKRFEYDAMGRKTAEILSIPGGGELETSLTLDELGRVIETSIPYTDSHQPMTAVTKVYYDLNGNKVRVVDANNTSLAPELQRYASFIYSAADLVLTETDLAGNMTSYTYDAAGNRRTMTDPRGNSGHYWGDFTIVYDYDELNRLIAGHLPASPGKTEKPLVQLIYDFRGNLMERDEPDGGRMLYTYTPRNRVWTETVTGKDGIRYTSEHHYDLVGNEDWVTDPRGNKTTKEYDSFNRLITVTHPENADEYESFGYDVNGNRTSYIDGRRNMTKYEYDKYNRMKGTENTVQGKPITTAYRYDRLGNMTLTADGMGHVSTFAYDELNRLLQEADSLGNIKAYRYDAVDNRIWSQDPNGTTMDYAYYPNYLVQSITLTSQDKSKTQMLAYRYDEAGYRTWASCDGVVTTYNTIGGVYTPDPYGRIYNETKSFGSKTYSVGYDYDVMGRMTKLSYPTGQKVEYRCNDMGQLIGVPGYINQSPTYNNGGLLQSLIAANGVTTTYDYDKNNRLTQLSYANQDAVLKAYTFTYDGANNIVERTKSGRTGNESFAYDELNQLISAHLQGNFEKDSSDEQQKVGKVRDDQLGKKPMQMIPSSQMELPVDQLEVIQLDYAAGSIGVDLQDNVRVSRILLSPNSSIHRVKQNKLSVYVSPDNVTYTKVSGWKLTTLKNGGLEIVFQTPVEARYLKVHCQFDERDNKFIAVQKKAAAFANTPDRLIKVYYYVQDRMEWYQYDDTGNRKQETVAQGNTVMRSYTYYENSNRLQADCRFTYEYDNNGNLVKKISLIGESVVWEYGYDLLNRLIQVKKNGQVIADYTYDDGGLRIAKTKPDGKASYYVFDIGGNIIYEQEDKDYMEYVYVFGKHFARIDGNVDSNETKKYFYQTDHLGSTVMVTDEAGKQVWAGEYTPFGKVNSEEGELKKAAKFTGKDLDEDSELYYFNARWYDPDTGRFVEEDSERDPNSLNLYAYCGNNPMDRVDPSGHSILEALQNFLDWRDNGERSYKETTSEKNIEKRDELTHEVKGDEKVIQAQASLVQLGYNIGSFGPRGNGIDGKQGKGTTEAIKQFQESLGLEVTGTMNAETRIAFDTCIKAGYNKEDITKLGKALGANNQIITAAQLKKLGWTNISDEMVKDLNNCLVKFRITTPIRIRHFISQCSHESCAGVYTKEIADGTDYEDRPDLGNVVAGDGPKYKGVGYLQLTGRTNYQGFANFINDPRVMEGVNYVSEKYPWLSAGYWWKEHDMNALCDKGASVEQVSVIVNGGYNGLSDRKRFYKLCCDIF